MASTAGCVQINGGAVEVSWEVHANGRAITDCSCANPAIAKVRIDLVGKGGSIDGTTPCAGQAQCEFSCQRKTGATPFDIPETKPGETYGISIVAVGPDGVDLPRDVAPDPVYRSVVRGQPTEVEAFLLDVGCAQECGGQNNSGVCARP
ncbi:MAG TPA: hypothetical protein VHJ20_08755 [Polyangia bacterium]|nr:hypothetical protein [Polyangia bacterium]